MSWIDELAARMSTPVANPQLPSPEAVAAYSGYSQLNEPARVIPPGMYAEGRPYRLPPVPETTVREAMASYGPDSTGMGAYIASGTPNERAWRGMPPDSRWAVFHDEAPGLFDDVYAPYANLDPTAYDNTNTPKVTRMIQGVNEYMPYIYEAHRHKYPELHGYSPWEKHWL